MDTGLRILGHSGTATARKFEFLEESSSRALECDNVVWTLIPQSVMAPQDLIQTLVAPLTLARSPATVLLDM